MAAIAEEKKAFVGFAGFGGFSLALREAGFAVIEVEIEPRIARVNRHNGGYVIIKDLLNIDPRDYMGYCLAQFSPPCTRVSGANTKASESEIDLMLARKICEFIRVARPRYFVLENVTQYRRSLSWLKIWYTLLEAGYGVDAWNLNCADYGVPQSRRRMIVIARRDGRQPAKPWQTHSKNGDMFTRPWVTWYEAVKDLIPSLERGEFAPWQERGLPEKYRSFLLGNGSRSKPKFADLPSDTITANHNQLRLKAFVADSCIQGGKITTRNSDEPMFVVTASMLDRHGPLKAFIIDGANGRGEGRGPTIRDTAKPFFAVTASAIDKSSPPKAFIVGGQCQTPNNGQSRVIQHRDNNKPIWTIRANENVDTRAYCAEEGYTVVMDIRCLARFQGFPDWFEYPQDRRLACRGIGNAVPPPLGAAIIKSLEL